MVYRKEHRVIGRSYSLGAISPYRCWTLGFGIWNATASSREMARGIRAMMNVQIAELGNNQRALPAPDPQMVSTREFVGWITGF